MYSLGSVNSLVSEKKIFEISAKSEHIIGPGSHIEYPTGTKNFVEDHPRNRWPPSQDID
jgi:hypothetical protein